MAKQLTKGEKLSLLFDRALKDLPAIKFNIWLGFCYGIFMGIADANRRIKKNDITMIAMELEQMKEGV